MNKIRYRYCDSDLLENKQNYQISPFEGRNFLIGYTDYRNKIIKELSEKNFILSEKELIVKLNLGDYKDYGATKLEEYLTESLLLWILFCIDQNYDSLAEHFIALFIKKFEIKKKIYSKYSKNFNESSDDFRYLRNYLLLSTICLLKYGKTLNLKFLNTALKINDLLCSRKHMIENNIDFELFVYVLEREVHYIKQLNQNKIG